MGACVPDDLRLNRLLDSSIHGVFLRDRLYLGHTGVTSFCVQFEKIGRGLLRGGKRREGEWAVLAEKRGDEKRAFVFYY